MDAVIQAAERDARALAEGGCDALLVENMGDVPYLRGQVLPETLAAMALATRIVAGLGLPFGLQVLAGANRQALGLALATGARFIRVEGFAYAHVADEGWMDACAGELLRARRALGLALGGTCGPVEIWADIKKKHSSHAVTADLSVADVAQGTAFCGADALVVTGPATGQPVALEDLRAARSAGAPVVVGSGADEENGARLGTCADAMIVGSWLKYDGDWRQAVDPRRVRRMKEVLRGAR